MKRFQAYVEANRERFLDELRVWCAQPSIAAPGGGIGMEEMAGLVERRLEGLGATVRRFATDGGPPILYAEMGRGDLTVLIYNHYDVQPPDPLDEWQSPPFEPAVRDGRFFARGVADDKGDLLCRLQAIEAYQAAVGPLPVRLRFIIEGEEEVGSPHLGAFAANCPDLLQADGCLWETGGKDEARRFGLELGVKGICYVVLAVRTAASDLHSAWGGILPNAAWRMVWALSSLKSADEQILVDGLLDHVRPPTKEDMAQLAAIPFDEARAKAEFGVADFAAGLSGLDLLVKHYYQPTCTICGLKSGYIDEGLKTVLPGAATAKVDFRLVPDLTPELVKDLVRAHLDRRGFTDIEIVHADGSRPARCRMDAPFVQVCIEAAKATYGADPILHPTSPGSGPLYALCRDTAAVMAGVAHSNSRLHAPNENIYLDDYFEGIRFVGELFQRWGA
jgi:acetylornithine deacetylase/succinyl-diaminopimelate desuccinylase-like protein